MTAIKVILARSAGFCFGVQRAVDQAFLACGDPAVPKPVACYGELIHNPSVTAWLKEKGVQTVATLAEAERFRSVIIRSHGAGAGVYESLARAGVTVVDATCTHVKSIQNTVEKYYKNGYTVVIVGDREHPEVQGVNGWCADSALILSSPQQADSIPSGVRLCVVAQTTCIESEYEAVCDRIRERFPDAEVFRTICSATSRRQEEAARIAAASDAMVVVGGKNSANTRKLAQICADYCGSVITVESAEELSAHQLSQCAVIGVTAGASTPAQIISEVISKMENTMENFEKSLDNLKQLKVGDIVTGEIISVSAQEVYLNIGYKSDGVIKKSDFLLDLYTDLTAIAAIGDKVEAMITDMNDGVGNVALSKIKVDEIAAFNETEEKFRNKETVQGKITKIVKGGVIVDLGFTKAFMPGNQYALRYTEDLNVLLGKDVEGRIIEFDREKSKIIFSRKVLLQEARNAQRDEKERLRSEATAGLELGQEIEAPIKNITDFGLFLDLNGVDGFVHVSDLSWRRVSNPKNLYKTGDVVNAKIIEIDKTAFKIKLSVKALTKEPWQQFSETCKVGDTVSVVIRSVVKFGAFAEILPGVEGLIHISNISHDKVSTVESVLKEGDALSVKIIEIDPEKKKIGLSIKDLSAPPKRRIEADKAYYKEDSTVTMEEILKKYLNK